ncbi:MAG: proton-conducting membrane transporter [Clostridia bacterium]|nr:proton-conducting membrane transporter [Clostridia bacterium]
MNGCLWLLIPVLFPILCGIIAGTAKGLKNRKHVRVWTGITMTATSAAMILAAILLPGKELTLWRITDVLRITVRIDSLSRFFLILVGTVWTLVGFYAFEYMEHEENEPRFYCFWLITQGVLAALVTAENLVTFYLFYEAMTLMTLPLVLHNGTPEAIAAGIKYLVYSVFGAAAALLGIFFLNHYGTTLSFTAGGFLDPALTAGHESTLLIIALVMILGFGTKAGMFPLHGWLPTAHPAAPAPASAVLSGIITKMGVLGTIRVVFECFGADFIRGTWVQTVWSVLTLITVFMGSMLALKENGLKKRLAYSSVSQVSYVLFGLSTLTATGLTGSMLHITFHAAIKCTLFMFAGAVICKTGLTKVDELKGIGKRLPAVLGLFTVVSLGLIGIPPTGGFVSKWYLAQGALETEGIFRIVGPAVLLISAILTAAYLLTITIRGFWPGRDTDLSGLTKAPVTWRMLIPMGVLAAVTVFCGMFPDRLISFFSELPFC